MGEYRRTIFDKHGPAALDRIRALAYGGMVFGLTLGVLALAMGRVSGWTFVFALVAGLATAGVSLLLGGVAGSGWTHLMMSGASTPYEEQYSYQQSLVMQGKVNEALASFEEAIARSPNDVELRVRAADLYAKDADGARRAAELLREAQKIPAIRAGQDIYATNRLVDLLIGPLGEPKRALVELSAIGGALSDQRCRGARTCGDRAPEKGADAVRRRHFVGSALTVNVIVLNREVALIATFPVSGPTVMTLVALPVESVALFGSCRIPLLVDQRTPTPEMALPKRSVAFAISVS